MQRKLSWGVIGAGGIADRRTIPEGIVPADNARLVALMDADRDLTKPLSVKYGVPCFAALDELLAQPLDAVYIATPTWLHEEQAITAARAGKHVFCEKPLALDMAAGRHIVDVCAASGVKLGVGFVMRFNGAHQALKCMLDNGELGKPVMARAQINCWFPPMPGNWRQLRAKGGGGALADMAVHGLDLFEFLLGPIAEVSAQTGASVQHYEDSSVEDSAVVLLRFKSGALGVVDAHFNVPDEAGEYMLEIYGSTGAAKTRFTVCQESRGELRVCRSGQNKGYDAAQAAGGNYQPVESATRNVYRAQIEAFSGAILADKKPPVGAAAGLRAMELTEAAYRAAEAGQKVILTVPDKSGKLAQNQSRTNGMGIAAGEYSSLESGNVSHKATKFTKAGRAD